MPRTKTHIIPTIVLAATGFMSTPALAQTESTGAAFNSAASDIDLRLAESLEQLNALRQQIADEMIPLNRELNDLESTLLDVRAEYQSVTRTLDSRTLDLTNIRSEIKSREEEAAYLSNLLAEYIRNFESRLHIAELQRYESPLEAAKLAPENRSLSDQEIYQAQAELLSVSLDHLEDALGGMRFAGTAVGEDGLVKEGTFAIIGPAAIFRSDDGTFVGTAEQRLGSLEPAQVGFELPEHTLAASTVASDGVGHFPLDPTLGNAHKVESTNETLLEHIKKGGNVMYPILGLAGLALLVALFKFVGLLFIRKPSRKRMLKVLEAVAHKNPEEAMKNAKKVGGPTGRMIVTGVEHLGEPRELIEEIMYEHVLTTRLKVQRLLPFVAICAASAPLLGLLGTVTGIINTFKMITVFGSGDVKTLSGGISEALITTEFGLIVAIPALLLHAFLSRKAKGVVDRMEKAAVAFINQVGKSPFAKSIDGVSETATARLSEPELDQMRAMINDALKPVLTQRPTEVLNQKAPKNVPAESRQTEVATAT